MIATRCVCPNCGHPQSTTQPLPAQVWCNQCGASFFAERQTQPPPGPLPVRATPVTPPPVRAMAVAPPAAPLTTGRRQASFGTLALLLGGGLFVLLGLVLLVIGLRDKDPTPAPSAKAPGPSPTPVTPPPKKETPVKVASQPPPPVVKENTPDPGPVATVPEKGGPEKDQSPKLDVKVIETVTKEKVTKPRALRLGVTPKQYDNMGLLLSSLGKGYKWKTVGPTDMRDANRLQDYDVLFLTCAATDPKDEALHEALRVFVANGGTLYASDLRFSAVQGAFPHLVAKKIHRTGAKQEVKARVVDPGLAEALGADEVTLSFDTLGWRPASFDRSQVKTYLEGWYVTDFGKKAFAPLLVSFRFGDGTVIFTSFHNSAQNNAMEIKLLRYLVFTAVTAEVERKVQSLMAKGEFSPGPSTRLETSPEKPKITRTYNHPKAGPLRFALGFREQGAELQLTVVGPDGKKAERKGKGTFIIEIPNAQAGEWQYTVTALHVPYPHFPFTLTVGVPNKE